MQSGFQDLVSLTKVVQIRSRHTWRSRKAFHKVRSNGSKMKLAGSYLIFSLGVKFENLLCFVMLYIWLCGWKAVFWIGIKKSCFRTKHESKLLLLLCLLREVSALYIKTNKLPTHTYTLNLCMWTANCCQGKCMFLFQLIYFNWILSGSWINCLTLIYCLSIRMYTNIWTVMRLMGIIQKLRDAASLLQYSPLPFLHVSLWFGFWFGGHSPELYGTFY